MKLIKFLLTGIVLFLSTVIAQTDEYNLELVGKVFFEGRYWSNGDTTGVSDCWGYTAPDGSEYAIIGVKDGVAFVSVPDLEIIDLIPGPQNNDYYYHRDMKSYRHYAYQVAEMRGVNEGLMIMDLQYLPDSVHFVDSYISGNNIKSHNFSIDTARGFAYICAQNYTGFRIVDLIDPENPVDVGFVNTGSIHDVFARNDTVWVAEGWDGSFSIYDCSDKQNPELIVRWTVPNAGYAHNIWPSDDGNFAMTTEETLTKTVKYWDVSDPESVDLRDEYLSDCQLSHNAHIKGNLAYLSHYEDGIIVLDISNPDSLKEVARYDTYGAPTQGDFYGNWGAYPFANNGYIYGSDFEGWLTVLQLHETPTKVENNVRPTEFKLFQNYPNPFNPTTTIEFTIPEKQFVNLTVYDALGNEVRKLLNEELTPGKYKLNFDAEDLSSGVYFYQLRSKNFLKTKKMIFLK